MTVSLCMIVKNEEQVLARALANASVYADEIVIVDTGSTDGTKRVAKNFTDKVFDMEWNDDFSLARNYAFSKATCDYRMWLDADDVVPDRTAKYIARLKKRMTSDVDIVMMPYVLERLENGKPKFSYYRERIIKNMSSMWFVGAVHEVVPLNGKVVRVGYPIYHQKPRERASGTRNLDIYNKLILSGKLLSPRERYYYARELYYNGKIDDAVQQLKVFIVSEKGFYVNKVDACILLSRCLKKLGDIDGAYGALYKSFTFGLPSGEALCELGLLYFGEGKYGLATYWFERAISVKPDANSGAFVDIDYYGFLPCVWLTVCYDRLGDRRKAYSYHLRAKKLRPDHPSVKTNQQYFDSLGIK